MTQLKVLLIGDDCLDVYRYGDVKRISPEAPVPVFDFLREESRAGMSSNVADNLRNLGCDVTHVVGNKRSTKTRIIDSRTGQQLLRIDEDIQSDAIVVNKQLFACDPDCVVISDYNKGSLQYSTIEKIISLCDKPIFIDTKKDDLQRFDRIYPPRQIFIKINNIERDNAVSYHKNLIVTLGKHGAKYNDKVYPTPYVPVSDVCGAGDTFLAALATKYMQENNIETAIEFANIAASITVQHLGVYSPTLQEIENATIRQS